MQKIEIMKVGSDIWEPSSVGEVKQMSAETLKSVRIDETTIINILRDDIEQDTITEQSEHGVVTFTCPLADEPAAREFCRKFPCDECKKDVWIDPKMYGLWQSSDGQILCIRCSAKNVKRMKP